jgi:hypothetical protein
VIGRAWRYLRSGMALAKQKAGVTKRMFWKNLLVTEVM